MTRNEPRRIDYAGSVHDDREIEAVVGVLRGGPQALRIGKNVRAFEQGVAELFGKRRGVMCNSGSSALYLAVELLGLAAGRRDHHVGSDVLHRHRTHRAGRPRPGVRRRRGRHLQHRRRCHRADDRPAHTRDPRPEPHRQRARLGPHPSDRRRASPAGRRGLLRRARIDTARHPDRHPIRHLGHVVRALAHHHRGRHRRHGLSRRRRPDRPLPPAAALGPAVGDADLRIAQGCRQALLLDDRRRPRIRQPLHLRRDRLELRTRRALRRVRARTTRQARGQPRPAQAQLRALDAAVRATPRRVRPAAHHARCRHCLAHVPRADPPRLRGTAFGIPAAHGTQRRRHPYGLDRERAAPTRVQGHRASRARSRSAERGSGHGTRADPAVEPQP